MQEFDKYVVVVGALGNMGRRYCAILKYLDVPYYAIDVKKLYFDPIDWNKVYGIIMATPTATHLYDIASYVSYGKPILCEKPITKNLDLLSEFIMDHPEMELRMINQYEYLIDPANKKYSEDLSYYSYYNSGNDGDSWDCINIIGMSNMPVTINKDSPVWNCCINGHVLDRAKVDWSYVENIKDWLCGHTSNLSYIVKAHRKAFDHAKR
jgi:hypothetical protein